MALVLRGGSRGEGRAEVADLTQDGGFSGACSGLKLGRSPCPLPWSTQGL